MLAILFILVTTTRATFVYLSNKLLRDRLRVSWYLVDEDFDGKLNEQSSPGENSATACSTVSRMRETLRLDATDVITIHNASDDVDDVHFSKQAVYVKLPVQRDAICYKMFHKRRGRCIIFNHEIFDQGLGDPRKGSHIDVDRIYGTFKNLGFEVMDHLDFGYTKLDERITELSTENHEDCDCICIFVLTHGQERGVIHAKDVSYNTQKIWEKFTPDHCPSLAGKPKLFFIQACRGSEMDDGATVRSQGYSQTDSVVPSYKIPTHADFLIAHSTPEGFCSWRSEEDGTWFIQSLCDVIDEHWKGSDLLSMLTMTARMVANNYASYHKNPQKHDQKQVPSITSMLIRDVYFNSEITRSLLRY